MRDEFLASEPPAARGQRLVRQEAVAVVGLAVLGAAGGVLAITVAAKRRGGPLTRSADAPTITA